MSHVLASTAWTVALAVGVVAVGCSALSRSAAEEKSLSLAQPESRRLPDIPDALGLAGPLCGISNGALIVAGGTNFPEKMPWENGKKVWHDELYVLESPTATQWKSGFKLPKLLAYGTAVATPRGLLCIGGGDVKVPSADVMLLQWKDDQVHVEKLKDLPMALAGCSAAVLGDRVYVAGGSQGADAAAQASEHVFYSLDLKRSDANWQTLEAWPGPERFYAVVAASRDSIYIMSGMQRTTDAAGKVKLACLTDGYRYQPSSHGNTGKWTKMADLPRAHAASPGPAMMVDDRWLVIIGGGVDDEVLARPMTERGVFPKTITAYDTHKNTWQSVGTISESPVATALVRWGDELVVPTGEIRSGVRSPQVWAYRFK